LFTGGGVPAGRVLPLRPTGYRKGKVIRKVIKAGRTGSAGIKSGGFGGFMTNAVEGAHKKKKWGRASAKKK